MFWEKYKLLTANNARKSPLLLHLQTLMCFISDVDMSGPPNTIMEEDSDTDSYSVSIKPFHFTLWKLTLTCMQKLIKRDIVSAR